MPKHTTDTDTKPLNYYKPLKGFIVDAEGNQYAALEGTLERVWIQDDPGNVAARIKPYKKLVIDISDETEVYRISCHADITFGWVLSAYLPSIEKGDYIKIKASPGSDEVVTLVSVKKLVGDDWTGLTQETFPKDQAARLAKTIEIVSNHPALWVPREKATV